MRSRGRRDLAVGCLLALLGVAGAGWQVDRASAPAAAREGARTVLVCPLGAHAIAAAPGTESSPAR